MGCIVESRTLGNNEGIHNYLVDSTEARNVDSVTGQREFAYSDIKKIELAKATDIVACLVDPGDDSHNFVETVTNNAGLIFKLFTKIEDAIQFFEIRHK